MQSHLQEQVWLYLYSCATLVKFTLEDEGRNSGFNFSYKQKPNRTDITADCPEFYGQVHNTQHTFILNSLAPGRCGSDFDFKSIISENMLGIKFMRTSCEIALWWMPQNTFDGKSTLVQIMAWCRQATSHYLSQCQSRSMSPYGITKPKSVKWNIIIHITKYSDWCFL